MIRNWFTKERYILLFSICLGIIFTICFCNITKTYSENIQKDIANEVIRFHVIANSDSDYDQQLKIKVRDGILTEFKDRLNNSKSKEETKKILEDNIDEIILCAEKIIRENGYNYNVTACISRDNFPTKVYGDISLPAGEYEALRILIGEGKGKNWWCVMFPPLCFIDVTHSIISKEGKQQLKNVLTDEEFDIITKSNYPNNIPIKIKFKIIEWWNSKNH